VNVSSAAEQAKQKFQNAARGAYEKAASWRDTVRLTARKASTLVREILGRSANRTGGSIYGFSNAGRFHGYRKRELMFTGLTSIYNTKSRLLAAAQFEAAIKRGVLTNDELRKIQIQAWRHGKRLAKNPSATLVMSDEILKLRGIKPKNRDIITGLAKYSLAGTGGIVKPHSHAILNPRVLGISALGIGGISALSFVNRKGEEMRTMETGSGRFGKDTSGVLGPAAIEGIRFKSYKKKMRI
jgi:hypothetical protein